VGQCREKDMADRFSSRSATWFSGLEYAVSYLSQRLREVANLGAFPTAFDSLQGNKQAASLLFLCPHCSVAFVGEENGRDGIPSC
jgi:hypothetical protein